MRQKSLRAAIQILNVVSFMLFSVTLISHSLSAQEIRWVQTNGPFGGAIWALASVPKGDLYAGARSGAIFRYSSKKASWTPLFAGATRQDITSMVGDGERIFFTTANDGGVFVGYPATNSWKKIEGGPKTTELYGLAVDRERRLLAAARSGLFRYDVRGETWTQVNEVEGAFGVTVHGQEIHAYGDGLAVSPDSGQTWRRLASPAPYLISLARDGENLYVGSRTGDVFHSANGGEWKKLQTFPGNSVAALEVGENGQLFVGLSGPGFSAEGGGLYTIRDGDPSPKLVFEDNSNGVARLMKHKDALLVGTNEGVWRSLDGGTTWTRFNNGLIAQRINDLVIDRTDVIYAGSYGGVFRSSDNGRTWFERNKGLEKDIGILDMAIDRAGHLFVGTYLSSIFRSTDSGASWHKLKTGIPKTRGNWIMNVEVNSKGHVFACVLEAGLYRSLDNGDTWQHVGTDVFSDECHRLVVDQKGRVYAANVRGVLYRSDDDGSTWNQLPAKNSPGDRPSKLTVDKNGQVYFGGSSKGLFRYSEQDGIWVPLNQGLLNTSVRSILFFDHLLLLGTSGANNYETFDGNDLFRSDNWGLAWTRMTSGLGHPRVKALEVNSKGIVFAGTWGGGVYKTARPVSGYR